jgi:adenylyl-sulfate kinase
VYATEKKLFDLGATCVVLNGRNVRLGLSRGLDFGSADRAEHLRRVAEVASLLNDSGIITLCAFVSPSAAIRDQVKELVGEDRFLEIHVDATAEWCEKRDETGLYEKAKSGVVQNMAGVNADYEVPEFPALTVPIETLGVEESATQIMSLLRKRNIFPVSNG